MNGITTEKALISALLRDKSYQSLTIIFGSTPDLYNMDIYQENKKCLSKKSFIFELFDKAKKTKDEEFLKIFFNLKRTVCFINKLLPQKDIAGKIISFMSSKNTINWGLNLSKLEKKIETEKGILDCKLF